jgi:predicted RNase H-like HicB family nuclease
MGEVQPCYFSSDQTVQGKPDSIKVDRLMKQKQQFTAIIEREGDGYVSLCPQLDIASQGKTVEEARENLLEALELFFEVATPAEISDRLQGEVFVTSLEVTVG